MITATVAKATAAIRYPIIVNITTLLFMISGSLAILNPARMPRTPKNPPIIVTVTNRVVDANPGPLKNMSSVLVDDTVYVTDSTLFPMLYDADARGERMIADGIMLLKTRLSVPLP